MSKRSWRLKFIDIDESYTISTTVSPIKGWIACRAPKGNTEAQYFSPGSSSAIDAMCGLGTAHWPDLLEAKAFNAEYGVYISAPPGFDPDGEYPSKLGGCYVTKTGVYKFYDVADRDSIDYVADISPEDEATQYNSTVTNSNIRLGYDDATQTYTLSIEGIPSKVLDKTLAIDFDVEKQFTFDGDVVKPGRYELTFEGNRLTFANGDKPAVQVATVSGGNVVFTPAFWDGFKDSFSFDDLETILFDDSTLPHAFYGADGAGVAGDTNDAKKNTGLRAYVIDGYVKSPAGEVYSWLGLTNAFHLKIDVKDETYAVIYQKSPTEKTTSLTISQIGYDKYYYDYSVDAMTYDGADSTLTARLAVDLNPVSPNYGTGPGRTLADSVLNSDKYLLAIPLGNASGVAYNFPLDLEKPNAKVYQWNATKYTWNDVTKSRNTLIFHARNDVTPTPDAKYDEYFFNSCWIGTGTAMKMQTVDGTYQFRKSLDYNTITFSTTEEVYPGTKTGGGEFHGSLDETGKDSYGANIYFGGILSDDDMSFVGIEVVKTFDEDVDPATGFFTGDKVIVAKGYGQKSFLVNLSGDRYADYVCQQNVALGVPGGTWHDGYYNVIEAALNEALKPVYDDAYVFMEPTGQEIFKDQLASIRSAQYLATIISPKLLTQADVATEESPSQVVVAGRMKGTAQYVGEFLVYDPYTAKKYYVCPIGDVGLNLARIIDKKYGGWAPMWFNVTGGLGGQLNRAVLKAKYEFLDRQTEIFDQKGLNPIVYNPDDGLMIVSQKTTESPEAPTDWSYLGHSMSFDLCKREIRDNVMRQQIGKPNSPYWQNLRKTQVDAILAKRTSGSMPIWAEATCDVAGVNTSQVLQQRKFALLVRARVYTYSELIELTFVNFSQS